jgi:hypothetical protein
MSDQLIFFDDIIYSLLISLTYKIVTNIKIILNGENHPDSLVVNSVPSQFFIRHPGYTIAGFDLTLIVHPITDLFS